MAEAWQFQVEESFSITGRGTAVFGTLSGTIPSSPFEAILQTDLGTTRVREVWVEFARVAGGERLALVLRGVDKNAVPTGAVVKPLEATP